MPGVEGGVLFPADKLRAFTVAVFEKVGVSPEDAAVVTDSLIEANLRGVDTHGITRMLCVYIKRLQVGVMSPRTEWSIARENASTALIDAKNSLGQVVATRAMQLAISKAKQTGIGFTAVNHANHYGAAAYYSMMALEHDMIGFSSTNAPAGVAPWGGRQPILGTNPFSYALPAGEEEPVVLDMATTVVARGRLLLYAKQNLPLEPGWALDERGVPTTDPQTALRGILAPLGGYKGYGLALIVDLLCGVMTGANYGGHFPGFLADNLEEPSDIGSVFMAINVNSFMDTAEFKGRMDQAVREIKGSALAEGATRIYVPGEIEFETKAERLAHGIPVPEQVVKDFVALGQELAVPFPRLD
ncbi:MAG: Ldh family oxidoreductase [Chloroflexi bacterium]|nr:Ldh family oxidoreductase [Chloroflexota bacterium]MCL5108185.1 Ldh family oxidoreductase [Chloroflexota bacterium]